jgi:L-rhamnose mutarotase
MTQMDNDGIRRIGMVIGIKEDSIDHYRALHDGPGVRDLLQAYKIFNFNIFLQKMPDGKFYELAYYEYHGSNYDADIARLKQTDSTQVPLAGEKSWTVMERIFFNS